jgi:hypothetical protein
MALDKRNLCAINNLLGSLEVYNESKNAFNEGDRVRVVGKVVDSGEFGKIKSVAPSGHFFVVKLDDGAVRSYHESDIAISEDEEEE